MDAMKTRLQGLYEDRGENLRQFFRGPGLFYLAGLLLIVGTKQYYSVANAEGGHIVDVSAGAGYWPRWPSLSAC